MTAATIMSQQNHQELKEEEVPDGMSSLNRLPVRMQPLNTQALFPGLSAARLFGQGITYTYDDVIFHPGHIHFAAHEVPVQSLPIAGSPWPAPSTQALHVAGVSGNTVNTGDSTGISSRQFTHGHCHRS